MTNEEIIAEFELELLKNHLILTPEKLKIFRQAARNLWNNAEQAGFQRGIKTFIRSHGNETARQSALAEIDELNERLKIKLQFERAVKQEQVSELVQVLIENEWIEAHTDERKKEIQTMVYSIFSDCLTKEKEA